MDKKRTDKSRSLKSFLLSRNTVQAIAALASNIHIPNFIKGEIYTGNMKYSCVPGLNCYSCPGATGACPIGSFQAAAGSQKFGFSFYVLGIAMIFGVLCGRFICGFLCPFGWFQDLLHKIPVRKFSTKNLKVLTYLKYVILVVAVGLLPALLVNNAGIGAPYFCKYVCPQGVMQGAIPLAIANEGIRSALGPLFMWKSIVLAAVIILSILIYRPFCKWICPLGAFYALLNRVSFLQYRVDEEKCISCGKCARVCKMDVDITKNVSHLECIRCGECKNSCPTEAISISIALRKNQIKERV